MKFTLKLIYLKVAITLLLGSCKNNDVELDMPSFEKKYVVESYLKDSSFYTLSLLTNVGYFEPPSLPLINDAEIYISNGADSLKLYNIIRRDTTHRKFYNYRSLDTFAIRPNYFFLSIVTADGHVLKSQTARMRSIVIDTVQVVYESVDLASFYIYFDEEVNQHSFYRCIINKDSITGKEYYDRTFDDATLDPNDPLIVTGSRFESGSKYFVTLYHITEDYYNFTISVRKANLANVDPFAQPASIANNIKGGLGIFTYLSPFTKEIKIP